MIPNVLFTDIKMSVMTRANGLFSGSWRVSDGYVLYLVLFVPDIGKGGEREREREAGRQAGRQAETDRQTVEPLTEFQCCAGTHRRWRA